MFLSFFFSVFVLGFVFVLGVSLILAEKFCACVFFFLGGVEVDS